MLNVRIKHYFKQTMEQIVVSVLFKNNKTKMSTIINQSLTTSSSTAHGSGWSGILSRGGGTKANN
jgi:hypothetical protein